MLRIFNPRSLLLVALICIILITGIVGYFFYARHVPATPGQATQNTSTSGTPNKTTAGSFSKITHVVLIMMENHNWSDIAGNSSAPYINKTLIPLSALDTNYYTTIHPSLPNYITLEAGTNLGITTDTAPVASLTSQDHLTSLLQVEQADSWKVYAEGITGTTCPLTSQGNFATRHNPMLYFTDVTRDPAYCAQHERPFTALTSDLQANALPSYSFIEPDLCDDMHGGVAGCNDPIASGDAFLSHTIPLIRQSTAYAHTAIFVIWDEGSQSLTGESDGPLGAFIISPCAQPGTYTTRYTHASTLRTIQEILKVTPLLGDAANANDMSGMFKAGC